MTVQSDDISELLMDFSFLFPFPPHQVVNNDGQLRCLCGGLRCCDCGQIGWRKFDLHTTPLKNLWTLGAGLGEWKYLSYCTIIMILAMKEIWG